MSTNTLPVLIIGGGPAGLAAALTLAQNGIPVRIVDKISEFHEASRGSGLQPRTVEMLHFLGVLDDVRRASLSVIMPMRMYKLPGGTEPVRTWSMFEAFHVSPDRPHGIRLLSQYLHEGILRDHLSKHGIHVELRTEPISMNQDADGVTVTLKKAGVDGGETLETIRVAYVVGADGARGVTRKMIGATFEGQTMEADGQTWADVVAEGLTPDYWHLWSEPEKFTISMRPKGTAPDEYHLGIAGQNFDPVDLLDGEKIVNFFHEHTGRQDVVFRKVASLTYWKPKARMVDKLYDGRIFIIGDAAHIHPPTGGQGLNTSVQDAINLCWKLALAHKGLASSELLSTFQTERLPVIAHMLKTTTNLYTHIVPQKAEVAERETLPATQNGDEQAQDQAKGRPKTGYLSWQDSTLLQLEINYRWSPILVDARGGAHHGRTEEELQARAYEGYPGERVAAGDRAPNVPALVDASSGDTRALFDLFKTYVHTVLIFVPDGAGADVECEIEAAGVVAQEAPTGTVRTVLIGASSVGGSAGVGGDFKGGAVYRDPEGVARETYGVDGARLTAIVVRPDAYVGAVVYGADGLREYFSKVFKREV